MTGTALCSEAAIRSYSTMSFSDGLTISEEGEMNGSDNIRKDGDPCIRGERNIW